MLPQTLPQQVSLQGVLEVLDLVVLVLRLYPYLPHRLLENKLLEVEVLDSWCRVPTVMGQ